MGEQQFSVVDLRSGSTQISLERLGGTADTIQTTARLSLLDSALDISVESSDPDMLSLIATAPDGQPDRFLYDEDCLQVALALSPYEEEMQFFLSNPCGKCNGHADWLVSASRRAAGWAMTLRIPMPAEAECAGLALHRFFRGAMNNVYGFGAALPHPRSVQDFPVLILSGDRDAGNVAADFRDAAKERLLQQRKETVDAARAHLASADNYTEENFLGPAMDFARERAEMKLEPSERFLCWNESYYLSALLDLFEITGDHEWLDIAVSRGADVLASRADKRGITDSLFKKLIPAWINEPETGTACTLTSGVIINPITRLIRMVHEREDCAYLSETTAGWIEQCCEVLDYHNFEWIDLPDGSGVHLEPYVKNARRVYPHGGSRINPLNREFWFAMPMLNMAKVTGNKTYLEMVRKNALYLKRNIEIDEKGCALWEYMEGCVPAEGEDISHAHSQVHFAKMCLEEGIVLAEEDIRAMAKTLRHRIFFDHDIPSDTLRSFSPGLHITVGVWSFLCRYEPEVFQHIERLTAALLVEGHELYARRQGWAIRNLTQIELTRQKLNR